MPRQAQPKDNTLLEMAIVGYQSEIERVSARIADMKAQLGQRGPGRPKVTVAAGSVQARPPQGGYGSSPPGRRARSGRRDSRTETGSFSGTRAAAPPTGFTMSWPTGG